MAKEAYISGKRDLLIWKRPNEICNALSKRDLHMAKEAYISGKRDLLIWKGPNEIRNALSKRDLRIWQKRPIVVENRGTPYRFRFLFFSFSFFSLSLFPVYFSADGQGAGGTPKAGGRHTDSAFCARVFARWGASL